MFNIQHREEQTTTSPGILITKDLLGGLSCNSHESPPNMDFKDLNYPPPGMIENSLELKLESSCTTTTTTTTSSSHEYHYQSVCTLEKVKNALQRDAEKERKRSSPSSSSSSASSASTGMMFAAGCPVCLLYVITLETNPICPRCNSTVSSFLRKKPRLDLNASSVKFNPNL